MGKRWLCWRRSSIIVAVVLLVVGGVAANWWWLDTHHNPAWLPEPRTHHRALRLPDGRVLVVGGYREGNRETVFLNSAVLYDPAADRWTPADPAPASVTTERSVHLVAPLGDGQVLVILDKAGLATQPTSAARYDPAANGWNPLAPPTLRFAYGALPLADGTVLVLGAPVQGEDGVLAGRRYDPAPGTWRETAPPRRRYNSTTVAPLPGGGVLLVGLPVPVTGPLVAERYDPAADTWADAAPPPSWVPRDPQAVLLADGRVLFAGGYCCGPSTDRDPSAAALYDPAVDRWSPAGQMVQARWADGMTLTALPGGGAIVTGGSLIKMSEDTTAVERYDPATNSWTALAPLQTGRASHTATLLPDGRLLVVGGAGTRQDCWAWESCWPDGTIPLLASVEWYRPQP
jgi:hypothetical protein